AADLAGDAERQPAALALGDHHRFDPLAVGEPEQILRGPVLGTLAADDRRRLDPARGLQIGAQLQAEIAHRVEVADAALVDPLKDLARVEPRPPEAGHRLLQLLEVGFGKIGWRAGIHDGSQGDGSGSRPGSRANAESLLYYAAFRAAARRRRAL